MKLSFAKQKNKIHLRKADRLNPHKSWVILLCTFILLLTAELVYFSWFFLHTTKSLDAPAIPRLETNAAKIRSMEKRLQTVESAIQGRTGAATSQNESAVVE